MSASANNLFNLHFPSKEKNSSSPPPLALGMLQWGTTSFDRKVINGSRGGNLTDAEALEIYQSFRSRGVVLFDTAEGYGGGTSEKRLGRLLPICTKKNSNSKVADDSATVKTDITEDTQSNNTSEHVLVMTKFLPVPWRWTHSHFEDALKASNQRLGVATCNIYLLHSPMHLFRKIEYWVESAAICKRKGLLQTFGLSNCSASEVRRAVNAGKKFGVPVVLNQVHYSLLDYNSEALQLMQRTCDELNVAVVAYNSLGQGLLTDKLTKEKFGSNKPAKMMGIGWNDLTPLRTALRDIADAHSKDDDHVKVSMAQVALSWCRAKGTVPLVGCRSKQQANDTLASLDLELSKKDIDTLDHLALSRCTLDSPTWRRKMFVILAGVVMVTCRLFDMWS